MDVAAALNPADVGRVIHHEGVDVLRFERVYRAGRRSVWEAVTTLEGTGAWAFPLDFEPHAGGAVTSDLGEYGTMRGDVIAWDELQLLEYAWDAPDGHWHVVIMLDDVEGGIEGDAEGATALTFDHLAPDPHAPDYAAGWHWHLDRLAQYLAGQYPAAVDSDAHFEELQRLYSGGEG
ncbi:SRPBCC domain-containing protein [Demequina sp. NBRC 110055]|uniref:SRPBCC domain-containing protein n=1 Tax=Demequina sp. NBRC 110055 TaxID=1570344 RepID=UPI00135672D9|nr:SRPBCC domain-containing protein [Demequina sp. NBRC 110055]